MQKPTGTVYLLRVLTLLISVGVLAGLVVQASLTAGCSKTDSSQVKSSEEADDTTQPPSPESSAGEQIQVAPPQMGGSKTGAILWPREQRDQQAKQVKVLPSNVNAQR